MSPELKKRFDIGYGQEPTVLFLKKSRYYKYHANNWTLEALIHFATESYHLAHHQDKMPLYPTIWEEIIHFWNDEVRLKESWLSHFFFKDENGRISIGGIIIVYILPLLVVFVFYLLMSYYFNDTEDTALQTKVLEAHNIRTRQRME